MCFNYQATDEMVFESHRVKSAPSLENIDIFKLFV